ncbi:MAG: phage baseplate assembly protein V [Flavobacteriaceae bacterium]|nr:phage baseplate assembly protein V [Flavobacteriaceae bacterium]
MENNKAKNKTKLAINGSFVQGFHDLYLEQTMYNHHRFSVRIDHELGEKRGNYTLETSQKWLGAPLAIHFGEIDFVGTITNISLAHEHGHEGDIILEGYSQSIKLEDAPSLHSWNDHSLGSIFEKLIQPSGLPAQIQPKIKRQIPYMCQFEESSFEFIRRLAAQYYEWLFWDGVKLVIGRPDYTRPVKLEYGPHLDNVRISIESRPHQFEVYSYGDVDHHLTQNKTNNTIAGVNLLGHHAVRSSQELYRKPGRTHSQRSAIDRAWMDPYLEGKQGAAVADIHVLRANCSVQGLKLNSILKISSLRTGDKYQENEPEHYGEYRIIDIRHHAEVNGVYHCSFTAIPSGMEYLPKPDYKVPTAYPQLATVINNDDPRKQGRIKARFPWQDGSQDTDWIQVMTPDAGSSDVIEKNRGQLFIPEMGDQVMIGFRYGDPMRPFAMGSMYHGENSIGGGPNNHIKSISTRSGHTIQFNDDTKEQGITITDASNNVIFIDTRNSSIRISAPENIEIEAKNISITASENISQNAQNIQTAASENIGISAGENISTNAGEQYSLSANDIAERATNNFERMGKSISEIAEKITVDSTKENMELTSKKQIISQSGEKTKLF